MPAWSEDFVKKYLDSQFPLKHKSDKPVVGFCGYSGPISKPSLYREVKQLLFRGLQILGFYPLQKQHGAALRNKALQILSNNSLVKTNFVLRDQFWGGAVSQDGENFDLMQKFRKEYVQNIIESDYILCARGAGNFSYRLYETLCCGRIPIFIDTDCVLPYDFELDWKKFCIWIDIRELSSIAEEVATFHNKLSPQDFEDLQHECRRIWEQWLSPEGFFANFYRHFQKLYDTSFFGMGN